MVVHLFSAVGNVLREVVWSEATFHIPEHLGNWSRTAGAWNRLTGCLGEHFLLIGGRECVGRSLEEVTWDLFHFNFVVVSFILTRALSRRCFYHVFCQVWLALIVRERGGWNGRFDVSECIQKYRKTWSVTTANGAVLCYLMVYSSCRKCVDNNIFITVIF